MKPNRARTSDFVKRRAERRSVASTTHMHSDQWYTVEVRVRDVSQAGFMAECEHAIGIGSAVSLDVPGIGSVDAQVRWQLAGRMGGLFHDPISLSECEWTAVRTDPTNVPA